jgi:hypothetical protein
MNECEIIEHVRLVLLHRLFSPSRKAFLYISGKKISLQNLANIVDPVLKITSTQGPLSHDSR